MSFISLSFAVFFVLFVSLYHIVGRLKKIDVPAQQILLLSASFVFYAFADFRFVSFLLYIIAISYFGGLFSRNRILLATFLIADIAPLLFFKYAPRNWLTHIFFPLGLSFFTFQSISYIADCYTKKIEVEHNPLIVAQFVSFFPVISSGPIQRADKLIPQMKTVHHFDYDNATDGMKLFAWGLFKKLCIADRIAVYVNFVYGNVSEQYGLALLLATVLYSFQIYCDFSGYSDMAIGIARYIGFDAGKNFDHPYLSQSVGEFWRRWHISLSLWLRDYVYIPLGGSRVALPRIYMNIIITFLVSGVWHGSTWNFVIWGLLHGIYQCVGRAAKPVFEKARLPAWLKVVVTFCLVTFAWIFFRAENLSEAMIVIKKIFNIPNNYSDIIHFVQLRINHEIGIIGSINELFYLKEFGDFYKMMKLIVLIVTFCFVGYLCQRESGLKIIRTKPLVVRWILYSGFIFFTILLLLYNDFSYSTNFIYQNF